MQYCVLNVAFLFVEIKHLAKSGENYIQDCWVNGKLYKEKIEADPTNLVE